MGEVNLTGVWVVIAAYNEASVIEQTVSDVLRYVVNVIVVDDCSVDNTPQLAMVAGAHVLRHPFNLGQGAALQTGIQFALMRDCEYVVTFDADGQHCANEIIPMLIALQQSEAVIALGSRFLGKSVNMPKQRRWLLKVAVFFTYVTGGIKLTDVHNGFRILTRRFLADFEFQQNRMAHASEILNHISHNKLNYLEYPVTITYSQHSVRKGQKHTNALRIILELFTGLVSK